MENYNRLSDANIITAKYMDSIWAKMDALDKDMPVILEHLNNDEEYYKYMDYLKTILKDLY